MHIGRSQRRTPQLYRPEEAASLPRDRATTATGGERRSSAATWRCPNCREWTRPSAAAVPGTCNLCGTPKPPPPDRPAAA